MMGRLLVTMHDVVAGVAMRPSVVVDWCVVLVWRRINELPCVVLLGACAHCQRRIEGELSIIICDHT